MRWSKYFIPTLKEDPKEAEVASHRLMIRSGLIQKLAGGLYSYLPLGFRVIRKVERIIREELNKKGAIELQMPILQPKEIWERSGRWEAMGPLMMRFKNREQKDFVLGPTHEEIITDIIAKNVRSYKDLPKNLYQIQTKFRDEIRPRFGVIRAKEFIMKDGYSFHVNDECADREYKKMYDAYTAIFKRCGLRAKPIEADTGVMGGQQSHEFTVPAPSGEDIIVECSQCDYAANLELAERKVVSVSKGSETDLLAVEEVITPNLKKVEELMEFFKCDRSNFIKTLVYLVNDAPVIVLIRGDVDVSEAKLRRALNTLNLELADEVTIEKVTKAPVGFAGPVGLTGIKIIADLSIQGMKNSITGANKRDKHIKNVNINRDFKVTDYYDLGTAIDKDLCHHCSQPLKFSHGIEVGQVFKLGTKYSESLKAEFLDDKGKSHPVIMGCYGIGVSRTVAAIIECNHDENGIKWPLSISPFTVILLPLNMKNAKIKEAAEQIYNQLIEQGIEVLLDDRDESPGIKFKDADLIGIPYQIVIGKRNIEKDLVELKDRSDGAGQAISSQEVVAETIKKIK